ncbi:hypothetical protein K470DRAFT_72893 [Piedraia hortae CBS 480.64]|uniref:Uncharacterized protein n=1 Tax=Piedraia hortae CBS 480.64 TaxID=1314780 RepID=A0A6A7C022_9PEZI|nr:hypothetical protein K470DRAFT_72893 [Piedraia hortae CBS 480.64]
MGHSPAADMSDLIGPQMTLEGQNRDQTGAASLTYLVSASWDGRQDSAWPGHTQGTSRTVPTEARRTLKLASLRQNKTCCYLRWLAQFPWHWACHWLLRHCYYHHCCWYCYRPRAARPRRPAPRDPPCARARAACGARGRLAAAATRGWHPAGSRCRRGGRDSIGASGATQMGHATWHVTI